MEVEARVVTINAKLEHKPDYETHAVWNPKDGIKRIGVRYNRGGRVRFTSEDKTSLPDIVRVNGVDLVLDTENARKRSPGWACEFERLSKDEYADILGIEDDNPKAIVVQEYTRPAPKPRFEFNRLSPRIIQTGELGRYFRTRNAVPYLTNLVSNAPDKITQGNAWQLWDEETMATRSGIGFSWRESVFVTSEFMTDNKIIALAEKRNLNWEGYGNFKEVLARAENERRLAAAFKAWCRDEGFDVPWDLAIPNYMLGPKGKILCQRETDSYLVTTCLQDLEFLKVCVEGLKHSLPKQKLEYPHAPRSYESLKFAADALVKYAKTENYSYCY